MGHLLRPYAERSFAHWCAVDLLGISEAWEGGKGELVQDLVSQSLPPAGAA